MMKWFTLRPAVSVAVVLVGAACASHNRLHEFDFRDRTISVLSEIPSRPDVLSGPVFFGPSGDPIRDMVRIGTRVVREVEAREVQDRLEAAAERIDVGLVLEDRSLERAARYLGADPVESDRNEDYILELIVIDYGIAAEAWDATAYFFIEADAALLDAESGAEIWRAEIDANDPIGPEIYGPRRAVRDVVTAAVLADLTVEEIEAALESLADYSARVITDRLRNDLRDARRGAP